MVGILALSNVGYIGNRTSENRGGKGAAGDGPIFIFDPLGRCREKQGGSAMRWREEDYN